MSTSGGSGQVMIHSSTWHSEGSHGVWSSSGVARPVANTWWGLCCHPIASPCLDYTRPDQAPERGFLYAAPPVEWVGWNASIFSRVHPFSAHRSNITRRDPIPPRGEVAPRVLNFRVLVLMTFRDVQVCSDLGSQCRFWVRSHEIRPRKRNIRLSIV